jgi:hypothetical protein
MTDNDKEILLTRILSGKTIFYYNDNKYILYSPSIDIKYESALLYDQIINEEKFDNWFREENAKNILMSMELWNPQTDKALEELEKKLDNLKVELFENFLLPSKTKMLRNNIKNTKSQINKIYLTKQNFISNTLEGYASSLKNEYIICHTLYENDELVFDYKDIQSSKNSSTLFNSLIQEIDKLIISTETYKILARSQLWRSYMNCTKYNTLFDNAIISLTDEQRALLNISRMYDNIHEHPECPDEAIIEDDDALDGWMIVQKRKNEKAKKQNQFDNNNPKLKKSGEVFLMTDNEDDYRSVSEMNSPESSAAIKEKMAYIKQKGQAYDGELPDVKRELRQTISQLTAASRKK